MQKHDDNFYLPVVYLINIHVILKVVTNTYVVAILRSLHPTQKVYCMRKKGREVIHMFRV
jgi:hypothetical protein